MSLERLERLKNFSLHPGKMKERERNAASLFWTVKWGVNKKMEWCHITKRSETASVSLSLPSSSGSSCSYLPFVNLLVLDWIYIFPLDSLQRLHPPPHDEYCVISALHSLAPFTDSIHSSLRHNSCSQTMSTVCRMTVFYISFFTLHSAVILFSSFCCQMLTSMHLYQSPCIYHANLSRSFRAQLWTGVRIKTR